MSQAKSQIFISYSRQDQGLVERLTTDLRNRSVNVWRDTERILPGTVNWEKAIREAIDAASAVVLVASPASLRSEYVQGELMVAKLYQRPIFPFWADGDSWIDSVPLDMAMLQYIDGRDERYQAGMIELAEVLAEALDMSQGSITVGLPTYDSIELNIAQFSTFSNMLNTIYMQYLYTWFGPNSYGSEWVLGEVKNKVLALPWEWLNLEANVSLNSQDELWDHEKLDFFGITTNSYWGVWDLARFPVIGIATNSDQQWELLHGHDSLYQLTMLQSNAHLTLKTKDEIAGRSYKHQFLMGLAGKLGQYGTAILRQYVSENPTAAGKSLVFIDTETA